MNIADLHCDLLWYLSQDPQRTPYDPQSQCSIPQMEQGSVVFQTLAIYTQTQPGSSKKGKKQFALFEKLLKEKKTDTITFVPAIENGSGLVEETEDLKHGFDSLEAMQSKAGTILYISLTWNEENRFGGGNETNIGLKKDGEALLDFLDRKNIAVDLSHTSDHLAHDILNYIERKGLHITPIASHSNFRSITDVPRNLPDDIAKQIINKKGVIGINCIRRFIGDHPSDLLKHIEHGIKIGGEKALSFGADFFPVVDVTSMEHLKPYFFPEFDTAQCYPTLLNLFRKEFSESFLSKLAHENLFNFVQSLPLFSNNLLFTCE